MTATTTRTPPVSVGRLARWKLTEPVLLYLAPVSVLLAVGALIVGAGAGEWYGALLGLVGALLVNVAALAARASTYSPRSVVQTALRARQQ